MRESLKTCLRTEEDCLEHEVMSWGDGLFKLSINLSHETGLSYINEFVSKSRWREDETKSRLRPEQLSPIQYQVVSQCILFYSYKKYDRCAGEQQQHHRERVMFNKRTVCWCCSAAVWEVNWNASRKQTNWRTAPCSHCVLISHRRKSRTRYIVDVAGILLETHWTWQCTIWHDPDVPITDTFL